MKLFHLHKWKLIAIKRNFYGVDELFECSHPECKKRKIDCYGWTYLGDPAKTTYTHFNLGG